MKFIQPLFAYVARLLKVQADAGETDLPPAQHEKLDSNFGAIVLNGLFFPTAGKILGAGLLLTWFLDELKASAFVIGLIVPIQYGAALLAQPWIGQWLSTKPRLVPYYRAQAIVRAVLWCGLGVVAWLTVDATPAFLIALFFIVILVDAVAAGLGNIAFSDTLARTIPKQLRGRARGWRGVCGAVVAGTTGVLIALFVSNESGISTFALLFGIAGICYCIGGLTFGTVREPPSDSRKDSPSGNPESFASRLRRIFGNKIFRRFFAVEALLVPATQGLVFFTIFGRREFQLDMKALGLLVVSDAAAPFIGNYVWGKLADRRGNRFVISAAAVIALTAPALAILLHFSAERFAHGTVLAFFAAIVFAVGVASVGVDLATKNFVLDLAPDSERPVYIGTNDTLVALPTMLLAGGGFAIDRVGYVPVFIAIGCCIAVAIALTAALPREVRG
jgi:MFS family permease